jgi:hypothetical protein
MLEVDDLWDHCGCVHSLYTMSTGIDLDTHRREHETRECTRDWSTDRYPPAKEFEGRSTTLADQPIRANPQLLLQYPSKPLTRTSCLTPGNLSAVHMREELLAQTVQLPHQLLRLWTVDEPACGVLFVGIRMGVRRNAASTNNTIPCVHRRVLAALQADITSLPRPETVICCSSTRLDIDGSGCHAGSSAELPA